MKNFNMPSAPEKEKFESIKFGESEFILRDKGAMLAGWKYKGKDIIPELHQKENSTSERGGVPICFPFFGPSPEGMEAIPQHGWLRSENLQREVIERTETGITVQFSKENKPTKEYPWELEYVVTHKFTESEIEINLEIRWGEDTNESAAPINPAFHPYFAVIQGGVVEINRQQKTFSNEPEYINIPMEKGGKKNEEQVVIVRTQAGLVEMRTEGFSVFCLWSDNPEKYACIEPVGQKHPKFNTEEGIFLKQGETMMVSMKLNIMK